MHHAVGDGCQSPFEGRDLRWLEAPQPTSGTLANAAICVPPVELGGRVGKGSEHAVRVDTVVEVVGAIQVLGGKCQPQLTCVVGLLGKIDDRGRQLRVVGP